MSQHRIHIVLVVAIATVMSFGLAVPSVAAQPLNDDFANAFVISGPGYSDAGSTVEATESPDDPAVANGSFCGGGNTVWYTFPPAADTRLIIDTFGSDYETTLGVYTGGPGSFSEVTCNYNQVLFDAVAGVTYSVVIGTCCYSGNLYGGNYVISVSESPPPFTIDLTIDGASVNKATGAAIITGTVTCNMTGWFDLHVLVEQSSGRTLARGEASTSGSCDGATPVTLTVRPSGSVPFKNGRAGLTANISGCDPYTCDDAHVETTFKL